MFKHAFSRLPQIAIKSVTDALAHLWRFGPSYWPALRSIFSLSDVDADLEVMHRIYLIQLVCVSPRSDAICSAASLFRSSIFARLNIATTTYPIHPPLATSLIKVAGVHVVGIETADRIVWATVIAVRCAASAVPTRTGPAAVAPTPHPHTAFLLYPSPNQFTTTFSFVLLAVAPLRASKYQASLCLLHPPPPPLPPFHLLVPSAIFAYLLETGTMHFDHAAGHRIMSLSI